MNDEPIDLKKRRIQRDARRKLRSAETMRVFYEVEADMAALLALRHEFAGEPDVERAEDLAAELIQGHYEARDENGVAFNIWDRAWQECSLATLAHAAYRRSCILPTVRLERRIWEREARGEKVWREPGPRP